MSKTYLVMVQEIQSSLRRKTFVFFSFGLPLIMGLIALILGVVNQGRSVDEELAELMNQAENTTQVEGFVDASGLIQVIPGEIPAEAYQEFADIDSAQAALDAEEIKGFYVIPTDYAETGELLYVSQEYDPISSGVRSEQFEWILAANLLGDSELATQLWNPMEVTTTSLNPNDPGAAEESWISELLPNLMALMLYLVIIMSASILIQAMTDEKKNRVMEVLLATVSPNQLITGKMLAAGFLGMLSLILWVGILWSVAAFGGSSLSIPPGFTFPTQLLVWVVIFGLLGYAMYGAQMAGLGALVPDIKDSRGLSLVVLAPLIIVYMFLVVIVEDPNGPIAVTLSLFPLTSPVAMITRMTKEVVPLWQAFLAMALQLATVLLIVRLTIRIFQAQYILSGQPVNIRKYFQILLGRTSTP